MASSRFVYVTYIRTTPEKLWRALLDPEFRASQLRPSKPGGGNPGSSSARPQFLRRRANVGHVHESRASHRFSLELSLNSASIRSRPCSNLPIQRSAISWDRHGIEVMQLFATAPDGDRVRLLQQLEVLGHGLRSCSRWLAQLPQRLPIVRMQSVEQQPPARVGKAP